MSEHANLLTRIRTAIADPGSIVGNRIHTSFGDDHDETISAWSARAVLHVVDDLACELAEAQRQLAEAQRRLAELVEPGPDVVIDRWQWRWYRVAATGDYIDKLTREVWSRERLEAERGPLEPANATTGMSSDRLILALTS